MTPSMNQMQNIQVGDVRTMIEDGGEYRVTKIRGDEITLDNTKITDSIEIYLDDLPAMFVMEKES